jgi:ribosomal protein S18 acetylase RimI-like enzyme
VYKRLNFFDDNLSNEDLITINHVIKSRRHELFPTVSQELLAESPRKYYLTMNDEDDKIIALVESYLSWRWAHLDTLWVDSFFKSEGIGTELLIAFENGLREKYPEIIGIMLETSTEKNVEFYAKLGFLVHGSLEDHPPGTVHYYLSKRF